MSELTNIEFITLAQTDEWAMVQPTGELAGTHNFCLFLSWIAEYDLPDNYFAACQSLAAKPPEWPGIHLAFDPKPQPGFVLMFKPGWIPTTAPQYQHLLMQVLWEIERLQL